MEQDKNGLSDEMERVGESRPRLDEKAGRMAVDNRLANHADNLYLGSAKSWVKHMHLPGYHPTAKEPARHLNCTSRHRGTSAAWSLPSAGNRERHSSSLTNRPAVGRSLSASWRIGMTVPAAVAYWFTFSLPPVNSPYYLSLAILMPNAKCFQKRTVIKKSDPLWETQSCHICL